MLKAGETASGSDLRSRALTTRREYGLTPSPSRPYSVA